MGIENTTLPKWRVYLLRAIYLLIFIFLGKGAWAKLIAPDELLRPINGVVYSFYAMLSLLAGLGLRYPIKMLPLLLLQFLYKCAWLLLVYLPLYKVGQVDADVEDWFHSMALGVVIDLIVIPWGYVYGEYIKNLFKWKK